MFDRRVDVEPLRRRLLARDDDIDPVPTAQTMVGDVEQRVGIRRKIDPYGVRLFVDNVVDETWILMTKSIVVLPPDMGSQKVIQ